MITKADKKCQTYISTQLKKLKYKKKPLTSLKQQKSTLRYQTINQQIMHQRRQNILNAKFNLRKTKLKQITKQNHKIYKRINSQKSLYPKQDQQKSYSRLKSISSSRASIDSKRNSKTKLKHSPKNGKLIKKRQKYLTLQQQSIQKLKQSTLRDFTSIFKKNKYHSHSFNLQKQQISKFHQQKQIIKFHQKQQKNPKLITSYSNKPVQNKNSYHNRSLSVNPSHNKNHEGFLHRIAQQYYGKKNNKKSILY